MATTSDKRQATSDKRQATSDKRQATLGFSPDPIAQRKAEVLSALRQIAPELISDDQIKLDALEELLSGKIADKQEHYELSWAGKSAARREIQQSTSHTLRPDPNNPKQAQHMLIEGENLEVLRVLQKSYYGKVKMIYIDPPYNTGNDSFIYPDNYAETRDAYQKRTGEKDEQGMLNKQSLWKKNSKDSGHYHSAWLSMMYPRLYLARNLLREDGAIFISIDDNELYNLRLLCDEIFGRENFVALYVYAGNSSKNNAKNISITHEYTLIYAKNISLLQFNKTQKRYADEFARRALAVHKLNLTDGEKSSELRELTKRPRFYDFDHYTYVDQKGVFRANDLTAMNSKNFFDIIHPITKKPCKRSTRGWAYTEESMAELIRDGKIYFGKDHNSVPQLKCYLFDSLLQVPKALGFYDAQIDSKALKKDKIFFDFVKPTEMISTFSEMGSDQNDIILDFFAGSGTTAHAVMELNAEDGGNRQSISVQLPEVLEEKSEAYKAGYRTIADITRARIEKVIDKIKAENPEATADLACAHFTLAPSNFKVWQSDLSTAEEIQAQLELHQRLEKSDVTDDKISQNAMLTELLLKNGLGALGVHAISKPKTLSNGLTVHRVLMEDDRQLWVCFEPYQDGLKEEIAKAQPAQVILLNSCFTGPNADEQISNLQLELENLGIDLVII